MARVFNEATGKFQECAACDSKNLFTAQFLPQRVPRTMYAAGSYATGAITRKFGMR